MNTRPILYLLTLATILWPNEGDACGQIFVTGFDSSLESPVIREYTTSGALVNPALISGLEHPGPIAVSGGNLFVVENLDFFSSRIGLYTTSGETVNPELITGFTGVSDIAVSGDFLYVLNRLSPFTFTERISKYTTSGRLVNRFLVAPLPDARGFAVSGDKLFVVYGGFSDERVGEFTTTGQVVNRKLIDFGHPRDVAISGENLFLALDEAYISKFTTSGELVNQIFITGFSRLPENMTIAGDKLFFAQGTDSISEYTTSGKVVDRTLISPGGAFAVVPGSEQPVPDIGSTWILLLLGLTATLGLKSRLDRTA